MATIRVKSANLLRRDTASNWTKKNPVLREGEEGYETDTGKRKVGDGITEWNNLKYDSGIVDQTYTPDSGNAQSGKAVSEAVTTEQKRSDNTFANALKGTASGSAILIDDVSPVTHEMGVRVRGKNLVDDTKRLFTGGAIFFGFTKSIIPIKLSKGTYTFSVVTADGTTTNLYIKNSDNTKTLFAEYSRNTLTFTLSETQDILLSVYKSGYTSTDDVVTAQLELGTTATEYTPYISDLTAVKVSRCGKNLFSYPYVETTLTRNGITFTDNGDGTITANGTATADTQFRLQDTAVYPDNYNPFKYLIGKTIGINGSPDGSSKDTYAIQSIQTGNYGNTGFTISNSNRYRFAIFIKSGITVSNLVFKPMIYLSGVTNRDYEFYNRADYTPNADGTVNGVTSLYPNTTLMTDTEGVIIDCEYNRDINKAFAALEAAIATNN